MRMYSPDELDLMAEAYIKALDKLPVESPTTALTQRLVQEIGAGVASGIRDEDELAAAAIHQLADLQKPAALSGKPQRCNRPRSPMIRPHAS